MHVFDKLHGLLLHLDHEAVDLSPEVAPENHAWDGDDQAKPSVVEGKMEMPCASCIGLAPVEDWEPKNFIIPTTVPNNPISGPMERSYPGWSGNGQGRGRPRRLPNRLFHDFREEVTLRKPAGEHASPGENASPFLRQACHCFLPACTPPLPAEVVPGATLIAAQGNKTLDDEGDGDDRSQQ